MAHDEKISEPTGNDVHHEMPASASAPAQVPDVATLRAMIHERQYAAGKALEQQLEADVLHAREVQEELLFEMIEANKDTPFGRDHGFADIKTVEDFKRTVPFTNYDDYAGYIYEVMEHGTRGVVTTEEIVHFNETSGTMGNPKGIPYTKRMAEILMGYSGAYTYYRSYVGAGEGLAGGRMLTLIESHYATLKSGISFGSLSCKAIADARPYLAATTTSPDEAVFTKPGTDTRYLHARFAIEERDIRDISSVFITGVLDLMRYVEDNWELLVRDIEQGTIDASIQMPADVRAGLEARIEPSSSAALTSPSRRPCGRTCWSFAALPAAVSRPTRSVCAASSATTCTSSTPATALRKVPSPCRSSWITLRACCCHAACTSSSCPSTTPTTTTRSASRIYKKATTTRSSSRAVRASTATRCATPSAASATREPCPRWSFCSASTRR